MTWGICQSFPWNHHHCRRRRRVVSCPGEQVRWEEGYGEEEVDYCRLDRRVCLTKSRTLFNTIEVDVQTCEH
jgi:hypothetical protein